MCKLNKEEIQFIDNYLIKNDVKYWDVRLEILDHIILTVEDKIENQGISFNEALIDTHQGFGNKVKTNEAYNIRFMENGLYADNKGFRDFTKNKQKELNRKFRKEIARTLKQFLSSFSFIVEYLSFSLFFITIFQFSQSLVIGLGLIIVLFPSIITLFYSFKDKSTKKSLGMLLVFNTGFLFFTFYNLGFQMLSVFYEKEEPKPYLFFLITLIILYPILRSQAKIYKKTYIENKKAYKLKLS